MARIPGFGPRDPKCGSQGPLTGSGSRLPAQERGGLEHLPPKGSLGSALAALSHCLLSRQSVTVTGSPLFSPLHDTRAVGTGGRAGDSVREQGDEDKLRVHHEGGG